MPTFRHDREPSALQSLLSELLLFFQKHFDTYLICLLVTNKIETFFAIIMTTVRDFDTKKVYAVHGNISIFNF